VRAQRHHFPNGLVARHKRILRCPPLVIQDGKIGMADAAVLNFDLYLFVAERSQIVRDWPLARKFGS
jgi:hypothetical protein